MAADITALLNLTLEIEGLLSLAATRAESTPAEVYDLLGIKARALAAEVRELRPAPSAAQPAAPAREDVREPAPHTRPEPAPAAAPDTVAEAAQPRQDARPTTSDSDTKRIQLTLNDKFRALREIFGGNESEMNDALAALSAMATEEEVVDYLTNDLCLDTADPEVAHFMSLVIPS